jgi:hypothetical protein
MGSTVLRSNRLRVDLNRRRMDRTPQDQTGLSRRLSTGVTLVAVSATVVIATAFARLLPLRGRAS